MDFIFDPSLVLYLPLHELDGASFMSQDAYGHLGAVTGGIWKFNGRYFDGSDDKLATAWDLSSLSSKTFTIEMWFTTSDNITYWDRLLSAESDGANDPGPYVAMMSTTPKKMRCCIQPGGVGAKDVEVAINTLYHLAFIYDASSITVYLNGLDKGSVDQGSYDWRLAHNYLYLARKSNGASEFWKGTIHEIRIYNRALSTLEVKRNYLATKWRYR